MVMFVEAGLTPVQAIQAATINVAKAFRKDKDFGTVEPGKVADLIMVSQNIFETDPHKISQTTVLLTIVGGRVVYQSKAK